MKLYPLLYINEAARTAEESLEKGIVAVKISSQIVLLSRDRAFQAIAGMEKKMGKPSFLAPGEDPKSDENYEEFYYWKHGVITSIVSRAIVGAIEYEKEKKDLYSVNTSAGVSNFGPLAYQILMYIIGNSWLRSDDSLTKESLAVWQKMYELSEQGVYEKKWLGEWGWEENIPRCLDTWVGATDDIKTKDYLAEYFLETRENELYDGLDFTEYLRNNPRKGITPAMFGNFWAYRKKSHDPKIKEMFAQGEAMFSLIKEKYNIRPGDFIDIISDSGSRFFKRRYRHGFSNIGIE